MMKSSSSWLEGSESVSWSEINSGTFRYLLYERGGFLPYSCDIRWSKSGSMALLNHQLLLNLCQFLLLFWKCDRKCLTDVLINCKFSFRHPQKHAKKRNILQFKICCLFGMRCPNESINCLHFMSRSGICVRAFFVAAFSRSNCWFELLKLLRRNYSTCLKR